MAEQLATPRISARYLDSFNGKLVMIWGKVTQLRGDQATIDSDGPVNVLNPILPMATLSRSSAKSIPTSPSKFSTRKISDPTLVSSPQTFLTAPVDIRLQQLSSPIRACSEAFPHAQGEQSPPKPTISLNSTSDDAGVSAKYEMEGGTGHSRVADAPQACQNGAAHEMHVSKSHHTEPMIDPTVLD
ncbi:replication factor A protein 3 domain-containing protein [Sarocladium implicatum]|nr:replication factor A protein 3 domain-containing protein [Sarocladium implicatum]